MGEAGFGWKENEFRLLEFECLRDIHREMSDMAGDKKYKTEV